MGRYSGVYLMSKLDIRFLSPIPLSFRLQGLDKVKKILFPIEESYLEGKEDEDDFAKVPCDDADDMVF